MWFDDDSRTTSKTINGNSVVLKLTCGAVSFLMSGDLNQASETHLLTDSAIAGKLGAHVFKAPHHGSRDFEPTFLATVRPQVSVISSGDDRDFGHPRAIFIGAIGKASRGTSPLVFSTEIAANFVEDKAGKSTTAAAEGSGAKLRHPKTMKTARKQFKQRLHGMINVRTDGKQIFAARRIAGNPPWEYYVVAPDK